MTEDTAKGGAFLPDVTTADGWEWYWSLDEENYKGPEATRENAIEMGREDADGAPFFIMEACKGNLTGPSADTIIGNWIENELDNGTWGDDGDGDMLGTPEEQKAATAELDALLDAWWAKHANLFPGPWVFNGTRNAEMIPGEDGDGPDDR